MVFEVTDTGIGVAAELRHRLFEPFLQADATTTRRFGGTGLGLAICGRLAAAMAGNIEVDSRLGVGSTFRFSVPLVPAGEPWPTEVMPDLPAGLRALVVDDNASHRALLTRQLVSWGVQAQACADAEAALAALRRAACDGAAYDVVLLDLDLGLPTATAAGLDGVHLAAAVADDPALTATRCLLLATGGVSGAARAMASGLPEWISKPVRSAELGEALVRLLDHAPVPLEAPPHRPDPVVAGRGRVLVAEDNEINQLVAVGLLTELGYACAVVGDGRQALDALADGGFDAVLMDCHMPELDGFDATRRLRAQEAGGPRVPVIAMTAGVLPADRARCLSAGMDDFVAKPVDVTQLRRALTTWVPARPQEAPMSPTAPEPSEPVLDGARLDLLRRIGPADGWGMLPAVITAFLDTSAGRWSELVTAVEAADPRAIVQAAHSLRGSAGNLGAGPLSACCAQIEELAEVGGPVPAELVQQAQAELARSCAALGLVLQERP